MSNYTSFDDIEEQLKARVARLNATSAEKWASMLLAADATERMTAALHFVTTDYKDDQGLVRRLLETEQDPHVLMVIGALVAGRQHDQSHIRILAAANTDERVLFAVLRTLRRRKRRIPQGVTEPLLYHQSAFVRLAAIDYARRMNMKSINVDEILGGIRRDADLLQFPFEVPVPSPIFLSKARFLRKLRNVRRSFGAPR